MLRSCPETLQSYQLSNVSEKNRHVHSTYYKLKAGTNDLTNDMINRQRDSHNSVT